MNDQNLPQTTDSLSTPMLPTSTLAIVSLVTGIVSFVFMPLIAAIVAIVTGYMARNETRANPPTAGGDGMATAGIILGWVNIAIFVLTLFCVGLILLFSLGAMSELWR